MFLQTLAQETEGGSVDEDSLSKQLEPNPAAADLGAEKSKSEMLLQLRRSQFGSAGELYSIARKEANETYESFEKSGQESLAKQNALRDELAKIQQKLEAAEDTSDLQRSQLNSQVDTVRNMLDMQSKKVEFHA